MRKKKEELDIQNLNRVIELARKILKISLVSLIIASIILALVLFKQLNLGHIILNILSVASPFFIGFVIAWLLNPAVTYFQKKNVKRGLGSAFVFVLFLVALFILIKVMLPMLYNQINDFIDIMPALYMQISDFVTNNFDKLNQTGFDFTSVQNKLSDAIQDFGIGLTTKLPNIIISSATSVVSSIWSFILGLIIGFYLLIDFDGLKNAYKFLPKTKRKDVTKLVSELDNTCKDFVMGTLLIACILAVVTSILFAIAGLPSPMLFGLICGITNIIPYIGPWIGGAIATIVGFTVSPIVGIFAIIIAFIAQQLDGMLLQPLIMGKTMKLHPVTIMIGLLIFGYFFGVLGMIIATPTIACIKVIFNYFNKKYKIGEKIINYEKKEDE